MTFLTRRWFDGTAGADVFERLKVEPDAKAGGMLQALAVVIGPHHKNLETLSSDEFRSAIDWLNAEITTYGPPLASFETLFLFHDVLTLGMHLDSAYRCRDAAGRDVQRIFFRIASRKEAWAVISADEASFLISWVGEFGTETDLQAIANIYAGLDADVRRVVRPAYRGLSAVTSGLSTYRKQSANAVPEVDKAYSEFLSGKRIAIVGPARNGLKNGSEIEGFDIVIRFNHHDGAAYDAETQGSRTDISFYTDPAFKRLVADANGALIGTRYAAVQKARDVSAFSGLDQFRPEIRGSYRNSNAIFFKAYGNALQRTLLDIGRFDTQEIKAFNMDMWVTAHDAGYAARRPAMDPHMFIFHDLMANYRFTKKLFQRGDIKADAGLSNVLSLSDEAYINRLQEIYRV